MIDLINKHKSAIESNQNYYKITSKSPDHFTLVIEIKEYNQDINDLVSTSYTIKIILKDPRKDNLIVGDSIKIMKYDFTVIYDELFLIVYSFRKAEDCCDSCGIRMTPVCDNNHDGRQYEDALRVQLVGGYGLYFDSLHSQVDYVVCSQCAAHIASMFPEFT